MAETGYHFEDMQTSDILNDADDITAEAVSDDAGQVVGHEAPVEIGGRPGLEPTRYGDWEKNGRCIDF